MCCRGQFRLRTRPMACSRAHHRAQRVSLSRCLSGHGTASLQNVPTSSDLQVTDMYKVIHFFYYGYHNAVNCLLVSPPAEHISGSQWWTDYQPVSYTLTSKRGNRSQFQKYGLVLDIHWRNKKLTIGISMITTCHTAGVKVIVGERIVFLDSSYPHFKQSSCRYHLQSHGWCRIWHRCSWKSFYALCLQWNLSKSSTLCSFASGFQPRPQSLIISIGFPPLWFDIRGWHCWLYQPRASTDMRVGKPRRVTIRMYRFPYFSDRIVVQSCHRHRICSR